MYSAGYDGGGNERRERREKTVYDGKRLREAIVREVVTPVGTFLKQSEVFFFRCFCFFVFCKCFDFFVTF
jgi:hypothetical protein